MLSVLGRALLEAARVPAMDTAAPGRSRQRTGSKERRPRTHKDLAGLSDRLLEDIGVTRRDTRRDRPVFRLHTSGE
ncbi:DUF1127 domain-containing protein [Roseospira navarrensis]|uniref:DUF1127 domain-containing protein n=1 Tax=Roseospira navarrensis TaxID=140058 RepID=A0A7X1ZEF2_9PROT|nr:DUF1127 domain-containing protein [Roseospira navarrensis]MQX37034.1 DUF1127 domain-containing protein [Roseospira navarrensis]